MGDHKIGGGGPLPGTTGYDPGVSGNEGTPGTKGTGPADPNLVIDDSGAPRGQAPPPSGSAPQLPAPKIDATAVSMLLMQVQSKMTMESIKTAKEGLQSQKTQMNAKHAERMAKLKTYFEKQAEQMESSKGFFGGIFKFVEKLFQGDIEGAFKDLWEGIEARPATAIIFAIGVIGCLTGLGGIVGPICLLLSVPQFLSDPAVSHFLERTGISSGIMDGLFFLFGGHFITSLVEGKSPFEWSPAESREAFNDTLKDLLRSDAFQDFMDEVFGFVLDDMGLTDLMAKAGLDLDKDLLMQVLNGMIDNIGTAEGDTMLLTTGVSVAIAVGIALATTIIGALIPPHWAGALVGAAIGLGICCVSGALTLETAAVQFESAKLGVEAQESQADGDRSKAGYQDRQTQMKRMMDFMHSMIESMTGVSQDTMKLLQTEATVDRAASSI
jgi:hypothetical protein